MHAFSHSDHDPFHDRFYDPRQDGEGGPTADGALPWPPTGPEQVVVL
ncbi:hypothetical protein OHS33_31765 [Streptomyces sp. NBC_00536]|nr:hypothetical protein [Streptomyces sp. NBC_00536]WUC82533.1 hypothetical protein OHS33_31765 [Streptomyces sp. NBC_00536]